MNHGVQKWRVVHVIFASKTNTMEHYMVCKVKSKSKSKKNIFLFVIVMITLNYKGSKDAKTGLGLVRRCLRSKFKAWSKFFPHTNGAIY